MFTSMRSLSHRPSPATVMAAISLFVSLGGVSYAAVQITSSRQIANGAIKGVDLADNAVTSAKIGPGQVKAPDIAKNQVTAEKIAPGAVTGSDVVESSLGLVPSAMRADTAGRAETSAQAEKAAQADRATLADKAAQADKATQADRAQTAGDADTVSGLGVRSFRLEGSALTAGTERTLLDNLGGLRITGGCVSDDIDLFAVNVSGVTATVVQSASAAGQPDQHVVAVLAPGAAESLGVNPYDDNTTGTLTFKTATQVVTVTYSLNEEATDPRCSITGTAVGG